MPDAAPSAPGTPDKTSKLRAVGRDAADWFVKVLLSPFVEISALFKLLWEALFWGIRPPYRGWLFIEAMEFVGIGSIFLVSLTALFVGAVLALQLVDGFRDFGAENQTGAVIGLALAREVGPVFAALMVTSRAGSAMTTELGSMRVSNQIDALVTMAVNPVQYLVVPRLVAGFIMVPVLTTLFNIVGVFGAFCVAVYLLGLDPGVFMDRLKWLVDWDDVSQGLIKGMVFGVAVTLIACRQGFYAKGGAAGVGRATNRAVVQSAIAIL
ncbi:MAG: ABC transporter permease, partial [Myxococcales bacterium]|nr:ABC transporter permease [Myxococcales bacterium]